MTMTEKMYRSVCDEYGFTESEAENAMFFVEELLQQERDAVWRKYPLLWATTSRLERAKEEIHYLNITASSGEFEE